MTMQGGAQRKGVLVLNEDKKPAEPLAIPARLQTSHLKKRTIVGGQTIQPDEQAMKP